MMEDDARLGRIARCWEMLGDMLGVLLFATATAEEIFSLAFFGCRCSQHKPLGHGALAHAFNGDVGKAGGIGHRTLLAPSSPTAEDPRMSYNHL